MIYSISYTYNIIIYYKSLIVHWICGAAYEISIQHAWKIITSSAVMQWILQDADDF